MASRSSSTSSMHLESVEESLEVKKGDLVKRALCAIRRVWASPLPMRSSIMGDLR